MKHSTRNIRNKQRLRGRKNPPRAARRLGLRAGITAGSAMSLMMAMGAGAQAATFPVSNNNNDGPDSLRVAIGLANSTAGPDTITFDAGLNGQTITLESELVITDSVDIVGPGADMMTIDANQQSRVFNIDGEAGDAVGISGLTLTGGDIEGASTHAGGAILSNNIDLTLSDTIITGNVADGNSSPTERAGVGGGVAVGGGSLTVYDSVISVNTAGQEGDGVDSIGSGGGVFALNADVAIHDSTISGNTAANTQIGYGSYGGGGVAVLGGNLTIVKSTISGNTHGNTGANEAGIGVGGGVFVDGGEVFIVESTISGNIAGNAGTVSGMASGHGGGVFVSGDELFIVASTVSGNTAGDAATVTGGAIGRGGGIFADAASTAVVNSTISGNVAGDGGTPDGAANGGVGGGFGLSGGEAIFLSSTIAENQATGSYSFAGGIDGAEGSVALHNTIVAENSANAGPDLEGDFFTINYSLIQDPAGHTILNAPVMLINGPAGLGPLASNGGATSTHAITEASQAFNAGDAGNCESTDQRGITRPQLGGCDMGAFELSVSIDGLIDLFDDAVDAGDLEGEGKGSSAAGRLGALRNMLVNADNLIDMGDVPGACVQLLDAHNRTDGETPPKDFVQGDAADDLAAAIQDVRSGLGCE